MKVLKDADKRLTAFMHKSKFEAQPGTSFNGLSNPKIKPLVNELINHAAKDFLTTVNNHPTEAKFEKNIGDGLVRFNSIQNELDTEDEEQICHYFEEIMDCVGLESSNGQLNQWRYRFDSTKKRQQVPSPFKLRNKLRYPRKVILG